MGGFQMIFKVGMEITNTYFVDAETPEEAEEKVLALNGIETLDGADYKIYHVEADNITYKER